MRHAPIALFVFNRPEHTSRTLQALERNSGAAETIVHIFADGPKSDCSGEQKLKIAEVRQLISKKWKFKEVVFHEKSDKWGLADSIIDGVTRIVNEYDRVIVLEDDIVTSPGFLDYMNKALEMYESDESVMHVSGYMFPVKKELPPTFFYNTGSCWGWGTWKRAWQHFDGDVERLISKIDAQDRWHEFNVENTYSFEAQLRANAEGRLKTWAVKWYASFFLRNGHALHPFPSVVNNIGHDGAGENCGTNNHYGWGQLAEAIKLEKIPIEESKSARAAMRDFHRKIAQGGGLEKTMV
jgi:hypothetical protein